MRGEWIEIVSSPNWRKSSMSLPMRGEWIEIIKQQYQNKLRWSLPMRGEWIEILWKIPPIQRRKVSPHAGRVD